MKTLPERQGIKPVHCSGLLLVAFWVLVFSPELNAAGYGYLIEDNPLCSIWWAEGAYKIMKDDPVPTQKKEQVYLQCAANEYEPFQLVLRPKKRMDNLRIRISALEGAGGLRIFPDDISVSHVEYVTVTTPTDDYGRAGEWPDPLPPYEGPYTIYPGENCPLWITVYVPPGENFGPFDGTITLTSGTWKKEIPLRLEVWKFVLPEETHIRSSFGLSTGSIETYHNLETREELETVYDLYALNFKEHRVCPTSPLSLYPMHVNVSGEYWKGGEFVSDPVHGGSRALKIEDSSVSDNPEARYDEFVPVAPNVPYKLSWFAKTGKEAQEYTVLIQCYNHEGGYLIARNLLKIYQGALDWKEESLDIKGFVPEVEQVSLHFFPTFRDETGGNTGTAYFDDVRFGPASGSDNLLRCGDFEFDPDLVTVDVDFSDFDRGAQRYLDDLGFNSFNLSLDGLGKGSFHSRQKGMFAGFRQGTAEYDKLLSSHLLQVENHLDLNGWLGKEYIYWFDEPDEKDYPFVREGMENIRRAAPRLTRFITEHKPGPDIMDLSEISCTIFHRVDPKIVAGLTEQGREFWSYLCTGPKGPWVTLFIDHPAINLRLWLWMSFKYQLKGILVWSANYWSSGTVFPPGMLQNPWQDPMSYRSGYSTPFGQVNNWGNGDGRFIYPPNKNPNSDRTKYLCGPVSSVRWEILREGIEDYEYLWLLQNAIDNAGPDQKKAADKGRKLLDLPESLFKNGREYTKDPKVLLEYRGKVAKALEDLGR
ncbi:MAG TPA: glycoside hydrolase domain-containing protein [archaeon]|nr:glycoside hydrolase domain-containing protein [archaeon]